MVFGVYVSMELFSLNQLLVLIVEKKTAETCIFMH